MLSWFLNLCVFLFSFIEKRGILLIFSESSKLYSNLSCVENILKEKNIPYSVCKNNKSLSTLFLILKSKIICIDQSNFFLSNFRLMGGSVVIQLWHGGGLYKKVAFDICKTLEDVKRAKRIHQNIDFVNISDKKLSMDYARMFGCKESQILSFGLPRTDSLYKVDIEKNKQEFLQKYPAFKGKIIYLYAPTFREVKDKRMDANLLDIKRLNERLENHSIILRLHPSLNMDYTGVVDVSKEPLEWVLSVSDGLISDYSSIIFDFAFFHRPILLYVPDYTEYISINRPLYRTPQELVGEKNVCKHEEELIAAIQDPNPHHIWEDYMDSCKGDSSVQVVDFMLRLS